MRVDGKFVDADGEVPPEGQFVRRPPFPSARTATTAPANIHSARPCSLQGLLYLLRRCHGLIYKLISSSEPISEELMPIANKLSTIKKCLNEVLKYGGPFSPRDLYPYHLALNQIDGLRKDGKFYSQDGSDSIPEGQAILVAHLSECHELLEMCVFTPFSPLALRADPFALIDAPFSGLRLAWTRATATRFAPSARARLPRPAGGRPVARCLRRRLLVLPQRDGAFVSPAPLTPVVSRWPIAGRAARRLSSPPRVLPLPCHLPVIPPPPARRPLPPFPLHPPYSHHSRPYQRHCSRCSPIACTLVSPPRLSLLASARDVRPPKAIALSRGSQRIALRGHDRGVHGAVEGRDRTRGGRGRFLLAGEEAPLSA